MEGKYTCAGTVVIEAKFCGEIVCKDTLIIAEQAVVEGPVRATKLVVRGALRGDATAVERVELKAGGCVTGDIEAPLIVMEEGAVHDGHSRMSKARPDEPSLALVVQIARG